MKFLEKHVTALLVAAIVGVITFTIWGLAALNSDALALRKASLENIYWTAAQLELQNERLLSGLGRASAGEASITAQEIQRDFDILWSRAALFDQGSVGKRLRSHEEAPETIAMVRAALDASVKDIEAISKPGSDAAARMSPRFAALREPLRKISTTVLASDERRLAESRNRMRDSVQRTTTAVFFGLLSGVLIIGASIVATRRAAQLAARNAEFAERAKAEAAEKARFLTMISHELRTPLNGVLASLALARKQPLTADPTPFLERAEQSGRAMTMLLSDALEHHALDRDADALAEEGFSPKSFGELIEGILLSYAPASHVAVTSAGNLPEELFGDVSRLRLAVMQFALAGERLDPARISVKIAWRPDQGANGSFEIGFGFLKPTTGVEAYETSPAAIFGLELIEQLGGGVEVSAAHDRILVSFNAPVRTRALSENTADAAIRRPMAACILSRSKPMKSALGALLGAKGVRICAPDDAEDADLVLVELGDEPEPERLAAKLRNTFSSARIVAFGDKSDARGFDATLPKRLDPAAIYTAAGLC